MSPMKPISRTIKPLWQVTETRMELEGQVQASRDTKSLEAVPRANVDDYDCASHVWCREWFADCSSEEAEGSPTCFPLLSLPCCWYRRCFKKQSREKSSIFSLNELLGCRLTADPRAAFSTSALWASEQSCAPVRSNNMATPDPRASLAQSPKERVEWGEGCYWGTEIKSPRRGSSLSNTVSWGSVSKEGMDGEQGSCLCSLCAVPMCSR